tara:strand:- start:26159 stop:27919 length:1761 start_codon:yes stop_codon:yes gene_type:complete
MNIKKFLQERFTECFLATYPQLAEADFIAEVTNSTNPKFGHYQCNSAMKLAKLLKKSPQQIALALVEQAKVDLSDVLLACDIAGPGFINISLSPEFLASLCAKMNADKMLGISAKKPKKIVIDFSSPNTAKEMHVGHLRSTIIGETIARVLTFLGHDVLRLNHVGDWGTAFGMLITYIKQYAPEILTAGEQEQVEVSALVTCYKAAKKLFDEDSDFKKASQLEVVALQGGNPKTLKIWETICEISRNSYQEIYDILDIDLIERGESFYNPFLEGVVSELEQNKFVEVSDGAKCLFLEGFANREGDPLPFILQKSDGGYNYSTTDMAAIKHRIEDEKADWLIYVTDAGQATHFAMLFKAAEKVGWLDRAKVRVDHVPFGLVLGPDGKKYKTRSGETEKLIDLINTAVEKAEVLLLAKDSEKHKDLSKSQMHNIAQTLGVNAIKYADLSNNRCHDYQFSYDRMLQFEGNTAAFLMYSFVRIHGIKRQLEEKDIVISRADIKLEHVNEITLGLHLCQFEEALESITQDLMPHRLCEYLYELADKFNAFFRDCRVIGVPEQNQRVALCELAEQVLQQGLYLLGLSTVDRM